jgi:hypothetical protein
MRPLSCLALFFVYLSLAAPAQGQKNRPEPLTEAQQEAIAEAGIDADARIGLYTKYLNEHADTIKDLTKRIHSAARTYRIDTALGNFSELVDELASNLDEYGGRMADMRKSLKALNEAIPGWQAILHDLPSESGFDFSRKDAMDATNELADQVKKLVTTEDAYFKEHKDLKGQQYAEPK